MKRVIRRTMDRKRPEYKLCQFCGGKAGREETVCPRCGRLMVRNLREAGKAELLAEEREAAFSVPENSRTARILFDQVAEEADEGYGKEIEI